MGIHEAALLLARLAADRRDPAAASWLGRAKKWAQNDKEMRRFALKEVRTGGLEAGGALGSEPAPDKKLLGAHGALFDACCQGEQPSDWLRMAVQLLRRGQVEEVASKSESRL